MHSLKSYQDFVKYIPGGENFNFPRSWFKNSLANVRRLHNVLELGLRLVLLSLIDLGSHLTLIHLRLLKLLDLLDLLWGLLNLLLSR